MGSGNWIVDNLNSALQTWNDKLAEIWTLISTTPEDFKGGGIWNVIVSINGALQAIGYVSHTRPLRRLFAWPMPLTGRWNSQETVRRLSPTSCKGQLPGMPAVMMVWIRL